MQSQTLLRIPWLDDLSLVSPRHYYKSTDGKDIMSTSGLAYFHKMCTLDDYLLGHFPPLRVGVIWMPFVRGITQGTIDMHKRGVAHNYINTSNIVYNHLTEPKICGMGRSMVTEASKDLDIQCYVRTILACFTAGTLDEYQFNDNEMDLLNSCEVEVIALGPVFEEVKDTLLSLLRVPRKRLDHILHFYWLFDLDKRIRWMIHVNSALRNLSSYYRNRINALGQFKGHWINEIAKEVGTMMLAIL